MRVVCLRGGFGFEHVVLEERPDPSPGPNELLLWLRVAALNFRDVSIAQGTYDPRLELPLVLGSDAVGEVIECGPGVSRFAVGDRVCPTLIRGWHSGPPTRHTARQMLGGPLDGTFAELFVVNEADVVRPPAHLDDEQAATLGCAGVTAYRALFEQANIGKGQRVLVLGTGGVSMYALLLARAAGAEVIVVSRNEGKLVRALELGANHGIHAGQVKGWGLAARQLTDGEGVDLVVEVGGSITLAQSLKAVRAGGTVALIGHTPSTASSSNGDATSAAGAARADAAPSLVPIVMREVRVQGVLVGPRSSYEALAKMVEACELKPIVDRSFRLAEFAEALAYQADGRAFGKICMRLG